LDAPFRVCSIPRRTSGCDIDNSVSDADAITIERVEAATDDVIRGLTEVLIDAVESGAGVSFMSELTSDEAAAWWRKMLGAASPRTVILIARDAAGILGTVQLQPSWAPNQPHRADVAKLIVHRRARGRGVARALMRELERQAERLGFTLLLLDTCKGSAAERLYVSLGWIRVGEVPNFALNPDGSWCDTVFFYKPIAQPNE
jgi:GNAT superfamily N-acetyltransferase